MVGWHILQLLLSNMSQNPATFQVLPSSQAPSDLPLPKGRGSESRLSTLLFSASLLLSMPIHLSDRAMSLPIPNPQPPRPFYHHVQPYLVRPPQLRLPQLMTTFLRTIARCFVCSMILALLPCCKAKARSHFYGQVGSHMAQVEELHFLFAMSRSLGVLGV